MIARVCEMRLQLRIPTRLACSVLIVRLARTALGWQPRWPLEQALEHTVDWYQAFVCGADMTTREPRRKSRAYEAAGEVR